jgi:hypothetical protein
MAIWPSEAALNGVATARDVVPFTAFGVRGASRNDGDADVSGIKWKSWNEAALI